MKSKAQTPKPKFQTYHERFQCNIESITRMNQIKVSLISIRKKLLKDG